MPSPERALYVDFPLSNLDRMYLYFNSNGFLIAFREGEDGIFSSNVCLIIMLDYTLRMYIKAHLVKQARSNHNKIGISREISAIAVLGGVHLLCDARKRF